MYKLINTTDCLILLFYMISICKEISELSMLSFVLEYIEAISQLQLKLAS